MPTTLQFRRGNNTQNNSFTGAAGEITFDTTNKTLRVHDASTAGGTRLATFAEVQALQAANALDSDIIKAITNNELKLLDSARATSLIDSAYVQARVTAGTDSSATIALIDEHALDSGRATSLIDSAYINARTDANIDSSALITLVENELKLLDSNRGNALIDTRVNASFINNLTIDADTLGGQNSAFYRAYGNLTGTPTIPSLGNSFVDSAEALKIVDANALDSGRGAALIDARVNATFINNLTIDADTLGGQNSAYHLNYNNFTNTPTIPGFGTNFIDSSTANTLADARIAANLIDEDNFASNSNSRAPSQQSVKAFIDTYVGELIDEDNMGSNSASRPPSQQSVKAYVDAEVAGLVDAAPGALNTLNELAAAIGDDANFSTTITNSIATKATLAEAQAVDPKLGTDFVDSAETLKLIDANALDSGRGNALIDARVNATFINNLTIDADTLGGQNSAYYRAYSNLTGTPTIPSLGNNFVDSAATIILADARIANNIIDEDNFSTNSATRAPSQQSVKAYVDANAGSSLTVQEEGSSLSTAATTLNFVGSNVTASGTGTTKTITITGSGGIALSDLSGNKGLTYNSGTGVFDIDSDNIKSFTVQHLGTDFVDSAEARKLLSGGTGITYNSSTGAITTTDADIVHDNLSGFVANEHIDHTGVTITAGAGLTGGGTIASTRTLDVVGGKGIIANANDIQIDSANIVSIIDANALDSARALLVAETEFSVTTANGGVYKFTGDGFPSQSGNNPTLYFTRGKRYVIHNSSYGAHPLYIKTTPGTGTGNQYASGTAGQGTVKVTFDVPMDAPTTLYYQCSAHSAMRGSIVILSDASAVDSAQVTSIVDSDYVNIRSLKGLSVTTASASGGGSLAYNNVTGVFTFAPSTNSGGGGGGGLDSALAIQLIDSDYVQARQAAGAGITIQEEGSSLSTLATTLNFVGSGVTASGTGATKTITISGGGGGSLAIKDEGSTLSTDATTLNFVGAGVTASGTGAEKTITISGGGGGGSGGSGLTKHTYFATAGQTQFSGADELGTSLAFDAGTINVYHNGIQLRAVDDYIESAGTNRITFTQSVDSDDIVVIDKFSGGGGTSWQSLKTSSYTAEAGEGVLTNTTGGAFAVNLPANPSAGDEVKVVDAYGIAGTNNVTIGRNNSKIHGADSDFILDINRAAVSLVYVDGTQGWVVTEK